MGRFEKTVLIENGLDRRETGYYSTPKFVADFMFDVSLAVNPNGKYVLDPCVGNEELVRKFSIAGIEADGIDIFQYRQQYDYCNFEQRDFLDLYKEFKQLDLFSKVNFLKYDYIIANPPYNCHEVDFIRKNKKQLQQLFPKIGVYNMYSMFLSSIIDMASEGSVMSIIVSDSFLTSKAHKFLREQIIKTCSIHYLILCPSDLFRDQKADVRTCIIVLQKGASYQSQVKTLNRPKNKKDLESKLQALDFDEVQLEFVINSTDSSNEIVVGVDEKIHQLFKYPKLGDTFSCITGISTGNDKLYLSSLKTEGFSIPFYKNPGSNKFFCEPNCFLTDKYLEFDKEFKDFMVRNKRYLLRSGITCSSMGVVFSACYLPEGSTFGVNPNIIVEDVDVWWLLSYLNSSLVSYLVRGILCRSNMITSGYVSRIPIISLSIEAKEKLSVISKKAFTEKTNYRSLTPILKEIDEIVFGELNLPQHLISEIINFSKNLQLSV